MIDVRVKKLSTLGAIALLVGCARSEAKQRTDRAWSEIAHPVASSAHLARVAVATAAVGAAREHATPAASLVDEKRVYGRSRFAFIRIAPDYATEWIGYLWLGGSARLKTGKVRWGPGCTYWYEIEPRGFVCVDGHDATLDDNDPVLKKILPFAPKLDSAWPHQYGESRGLAKYRELPSVEQQRQREWDLAPHLKAVAALRDAAPNDKIARSLVGLDLTQPADAPIDFGSLPGTLHENRTKLMPLSTVAYSHAVFDGTRSWLLTADFTWVPKDRVAPYPKVVFHGVELGKDANLPLAFFRGQDRPKYRWDANGSLESTDQKWKRLAFVELTGKSAEFAGDKYLETRESGFWVKASDAVVPKPQSATPWGAPVGREDTTGAAPRGRGTWLEASITKGWLIAYVGTRPVFATMISPGRGGVPTRGIDPLKTASTPVGIFQITGKFKTATMEAPGEFIHSDVPWAQNFHGPHALHAAYWHDNWGNPMSGGCVNVSPIDGKWLFEFTEPAMPDGWHGLRWQPSLEPATTFVVHE